jgi:hypothetical protein
MTYVLRADLSMKDLSLCCHEHIGSVCLINLVVVNDGAIQMDLCLTIVCRLILDRTIHQLIPTFIFAEIMLSHGHKYIGELFEVVFVKLHLLKLYHIPCQ